MAQAEKINEKIGKTMEKIITSDNAKVWLKKQTRPYRAAILFLTFLNVLCTGLSLVFAYLVRYLINGATDGSKKTLVVFSLVLLSVLLVKILLNTLMGFLAERLRARIVTDLRKRVFAQILRSEYADLQGYHSGDLLNRLTSDIQEVATNSVGLLPAAVGMLVQCVGAIVALATIDPLFTLIYVVCGSIFGLISAFFRKQIKKRQKEVLQADGNSRAFMQESISSVMTVKAYRAEEKTTEKAEALGELYYKKRMKRNAVNVTMNGVFSLLGNFGLIFAVVWCSVSVLNGNTDYGSILSVILLLQQLQHPFSAFSSVVPAYYARLTSGERLGELEELKKETLERAENVETLYAKAKQIVAENLSFTYGRNEIFSGANATIEKGEIVCLTGNSGSGKSTLFKLLLDVYKPSGGALLLKGDFKQGDNLPLTAKERGLFAYVPQGNFLFSGTIYENLTFFMEESEKTDVDAKIKRALTVACAEFVYELPQGLQTLLTESGGGLSEGQTQRLAVARAILCNRPILLLDEATSALDGETEKQLLENVRALTNVTCLIVTHRPAALAIANRVLVVEKGKIDEKA